MHAERTIAVGLGRSDRSHLPEAKRPSYGPLESSPAQHLSVLSTPRRRASLQQLKDNSISSHTLRHASSFSPSLIVEGESESLFHKSVEGLSSDTQLRDPPLQAQESAFLRDNKFSNPGTSSGQLGHENLKHENNRSPPNLPETTEGLSHFSRPMQKEQVQTSSRRHIVPPEEFAEWMKEPLSDSDMAQQLLPEDGATKNPEHIFIDHTIGNHSFKPSSFSMHTSDDQRGAGLRPPPRKRLGLAARQAAARKKDESIVVSQPPVSNGIRKLENFKSTTKSRPPSLHRSASFLTLEEEEEKTGTQMLTKEPSGPIPGWEFDTASEEEEESFFEFGRGVNSLDFSEGFSD